MGRSCYNRCMPDSLNAAFTRKYLVQWLYVAAALVAIVSVCVWWTQVYENPYNVYWGMLENSLKTTGVTKHVTETANGTNLNQYISLDFGASNLAFARTTLSGISGTVKTESIGTLQSDYVRYTTVKVTGKGKQPSVSKLLNRWAKANVANTSDSSASVPFFVQVMLGFEGGNLVPLANLPADARAKLMKQLHNDVIFQTSFSDVKRQKVEGRQVYTYNVEIEPVAYVAFQKAFAQSVGIKTLDEVDPNSYQGQSAIKVQLLVDARSHQLVGIHYSNAQHNETYSGYGVTADVEVPKATITNQELQTLLSAAQ